MQDRVCILMATYNGAKNLPAQLQSFAAQSHARWDLIASDDGSADATADILRGFARQRAAAGNRVSLIEGPRRGLVVNFLHLLAQAPGTASWLAISDQDDVWLPDRLARGIAALSPLPDAVPALYCSRTWITDTELGNRRLSARYDRPPEFRNALVQNIAAGNTILLNAAAAALVRAAAPAAAAVPGVPAHDWWLYQVITGVGGTVIRDPAPTLLYRQHGNNQIGENASPQARAARIAKVLSGGYSAWNTANIAALRGIGNRLTPANRALLEDFAAMRGKPPLARMRAFARLGIHRQGRLGQAALWLAVLIGRC